MGAMQWLRVLLCGKARASLPGTFLRGIRKRDFINDDGSAHYTAFEPPKANPRRNDGGAELSVNWEDDSGALELLFRDRSNSEGGVARVSLKVLGVVNAAPAAKPDALRPERAPTKGNSYHGNIVFRGDLGKPLVRLIAGTLALYAEVVRRPE